MPVPDEARGGGGLKASSKIVIEADVRPQEEDTPQESSRFRLNDLTKHQPQASSAGQYAHVILHENVFSKNAGLLDPCAKAQGVARQ